MGFHNRPRNGSPHAHPFQFAGDKRLEDLFQFVFGNSQTTIRYRQLGKIATCEVRMLIARSSLGVSAIASIALTTS